jgi:hypothetical protein
MGIIRAPGYLFPVVDDGDRLVQFELGSLDEVGEVRLEERQVLIARAFGVGYWPVLRR